MTSAPHKMLQAAALLAATASLSAQQVPSALQFDELRPIGWPEAFDDSQAAAAGDVDGDGDLDVVIAVSRGANRLLLNDGSGLFTDGSARLPRNVGDSFDVTLVDVDGDGDLDLVDADFQQTRLALNDGAGNFADVTAQQVVPGTSGNRALAVGDIDGDGDPDLILARNGASAQNLVLQNDGSGSFADVTATALSPAGANADVALADFDGDGDLDLAFATGSFSGAPNRLLLNNGSGVFADASSQLPAVRFNTTSVAAADVDGDGDVDLCFGNLIGPTLGGIRNELYLNDGTGRFVDVTANAMPTSQRYTYTVAFADLNGDGAPDLLVGNEGACGAALNDGTGAFPATMTPLAGATFVGGFATGDLDGDGDVDVVATQVSGRQDRLYLNDGAGGLADATPPNALRLGTGFLSHLTIVEGDLDGDGDLDLVWGGTDSGLGGPGALTYRNDGNGSFEFVADLPAVNPAGLALGDLDNDGDLDLVVGTAVGNYGGGPSVVFVGDGAGNFTALNNALPAVQASSVAVALGDIDGDGDLDAVMANVPSRPRPGVPGQNRLYLNSGSGVFSDVTATQLPGDNEATRAVAFADLDGDGDLDLVFGNDGSDFVYRNDGMGTFTDVSAVALPFPAHPTGSIAVGDLDDDGDLDLYLAVGLGFTGASDRLLLNDGSGIFLDASAALTPSSTGAAEMADIDEDGDLDIVALGAQSRIHRNDGASLTDVGARLPAIADASRALAVGDFDGDGDLDIVGSRVFFNLFRQTWMPAPPRTGAPVQVEVHARFGPASSTDVAWTALSPAPGLVPTAFGDVLLDPAQAVSLTPFAIARPAGSGTVSFPIPNIPSLAGLPLHAQSLLIRSNAATRLTNVAVEPIR